jgi:glycogen debranching enzyme
VGASLGGRFGEREFAARSRRDRALATSSFSSRFWSEEGGYFYDVVDGEGGDDASLRPNQIYLVALTDKLLTKQQQRCIVQEQFLTPVGLRTIAAACPEYRARYEGGVVERDGACHQGTVWPFLLGPFVTAWVKVHGHGEAAMRQGRKLLQGWNGIWKNPVSVRSRKSSTQTRLTSLGVAWLRSGRWPNHSGRCSKM